MVSLVLSDNTAAQSHSLYIDDKVAGLVIDVKKWNDVKKVVDKKAKEHTVNTKEARKKVENKLALAQSEHSCYLKEVLPTTLDQAQKQAVVDYENSSEFKAQLLAKYKEGMRDMKFSFTLANLSLTELN